MSLTVRPLETPSTWVWTAPETPTTHRSEFEELILGDMAEGGLVLTVVFESVVVLTVDVDVDCVTIGSAAMTGKTHIIQKAITMKPAITLLRNRLDIVLFLYHYGFSNASTLADSSCIAFTKIGNIFIGSVSRASGLSSCTNLIWSA